ncbi:MAG TPA: DUF58 domain-containing protein [Streptosporangiaceae bacterium]|nr:DUF58 domain-containing protein [Streptosporangiaceae bacterium]
MRSVLAWFTIRGMSFLTAGIVGVLAGLTLGSEAMISVGVMLIGLPVFSALTARRARYQLRCDRRIVPPRVAPGQPATVTVRLENVSRLATGLLLAEDSIPYSLGARPRYVLNGIERGGSREVSYQLRSDLRGKFVVGPLRVRIADVFGLVELTANFATQNTLTVTPKVVRLVSGSTTGSWSSDGDGRTRMTAAAGDDDVIPRAYRDGDELRRVHWRSTARYGELMVRREEQRWQDRAVVILDTRRSAHAGSGPSSSFEFAVSAAASIGVHLARSGLDGHLLTDAGPLAGSAMFEDVLLDALSVVTMSRNYDFARTTAALSTIEGGLLVLVAGQLSVAAAREVAAARRHGRQGIAILLAVSTWAAQPSEVGHASRSGQSAGTDGPAGVAGEGDQLGQAGQGKGSQGKVGQGRNGHQDLAADGQGPDGYRELSAADGQGPSGPGRKGNGKNGSDMDAWSADSEGRAAGRGTTGDGDTAAAAAVFRAAGWRVVTVDASTPLAVAWQRLPKAGGYSDAASPLPAASQPVSTGRTTSQARRAPGSEEDLDLGAAAS